MAAKIIVAGLGSGSFEQLTLGVWELLQSGRPIFLRTADHPVAAELAARSIAFQSFDDLYGKYEAFDDVYEAIARTLVEMSLSDRAEILYAVPGHPSVAEAAVKLLRERCRDAGVELEFRGGESFLDQAFLRFGVDPIEGFALCDARGLEASLLDPRRHLFITQVYDAFTASEAKLALMARYPDDYAVKVGKWLGVPGKEAISEVPLWQLDRLEDYGNAAMIWVPPSNDERLRYRSFDYLKEIVANLRSPEGCPWDREQTHASLKKNLIEEAYEVLETIDDDDPDAMREELGDLLLQVMLHAQMEAENGVFEAEDVIQTLNEKLIRRHPHVFGEVKADNAEAALENWEAVKRQEKAAQGTGPAEPASALDGVPRDLPALMRAYKTQKKAAAVGFDWSDVADCLNKVDEELRELRAELAVPGEEGQAKRTEELGDLLFAVVNVARFLKVDPEQALVGTVRKFRERFAYIESQLRLKQQSLDDTDLSEMELYWEQAKSKSKEHTGKA